MLPHPVVEPETRSGTFTQSLGRFDTARHTLALDDPHLNLGSTPLTDREIDELLEQIGTEGTSMLRTFDAVVDDRLDEGESPFWGPNKVDFVSHLMKQYGRETRPG